MGTRWEDAFAMSRVAYGPGEHALIRELRAMRARLQSGASVTWAARAWWAGVECENVARPAEALRLLRLVRDLRLTLDDAFACTGGAAVGAEGAIVSAAWNRSAARAARLRALEADEPQPTGLPKPSWDAVDALRRQAVALEPDDLMVHGVPHLDVTGWREREVRQRIADLRAAFLDTDFPDATPGRTWAEWQRVHGEAPARTLWLAEELAFRGLDLYDLEVTQHELGVRDPFVAYGLLLARWRIRPARWTGPREWGRHGHWRAEWTGREQ
jgi:hypothetical protein